ncbi:MAG: M60 family peptidase N-terminal accessory domain-containing protein, partial [Planctomycetota bacterium]
MSALATLKAHVEGSPGLDAKQVEAHKLTIDKHRKLFGHNGTIIKAAFDLVATYDKVNGPLWVSGKSFNRGRSRKPTPPPKDIHWTVYNVMQNIMDFVYTPGNVARYADILDGLKFGCSAHFPGAVAPPADPDAVYRVKINASYPKPFKHKIMHEERPARRPTGAYLAPGSIATVTVPAALVGKGYQVRVGAHCWDLSRKPRVLRLDRVTLLYPIDSTDVKVASPLGGGIYIEVPLRADAAGVVEIAIRN